MVWTPDLNSLDIPPLFHKDNTRFNNFGETRTSAESSYLLGTVNRSVVFDGSSTGHHHPTSDGVDGVGSKSSGHGDGVTEEESEEEAGVVSEHGNDTVVDTEVETSVHEDTHAGDDETGREARVREKQGL